MCDARSIFNRGAHASLIFVGLREQKTLGSTVDDEPPVLRRHQTACVCLLPNE